MQLRRDWAGYNHGRRRSDLHYAPLLRKNPAGGLLQQRRPDRSIRSEYRLGCNNEQQLILSLSFGRYFPG